MGKKDEKTRVLIGRNQVAGFMCLIYPSRAVEGSPSAEAMLLLSRLKSSRAQEDPCTRRRISQFFMILQQLARLLPGLYERIGKFEAH